MIDTLPAALPSAVIGMDSNGLNAELAKYNVLARVRTPLTPSRNFAAKSQTRILDS